MFKQKLKNETKEELEQIKTWKYKSFDYKNDWLKNEKKKWEKNLSSFFGAR